MCIRDRDTVFSANTTVYAHWPHTGDNNPPVNYYTLRFETGGGSAIPGVQETYNTYIDLTKYCLLYTSHRCRFPPEAFAK